MALSRRRITPAAAALAASVYILASALAGVLWTQFGPAATFTAGAGFAAAVVLAMLWGTFRSRETS